MTVEYRVELFLSGAWVDTTNIGGLSYLAADVDGAVTPVTIVRGRQDWASDVDAGTCRFTLLDDTPPSGRWSPDNPAGPYYGQLNVNTPVRVVVTRSAVAYTRFVGELSSVGPPQWDPAGERVVYPCEAAGILRRLGRWSDPVRSVLRREIPRVFNDLKAYWPLEDTETRQRPAAGLDTHDSMRVTGNPDFGSYDAFEASRPILVLRDADLHGQVPWYSYITGAAVIQLGFLLHVPESGSTSGQTILHVVTSRTARRWEIQYLTADGGSLRLRCVDDGEVERLLTTGDPWTQINGRNLHVGLRLAKNGTDIDWTLQTLRENGAVATRSGFLGGDFSLGRATSIRVNYKGGHDDVAVGHVYVLSQPRSFLTVKPLLAAYENEPAGRRIERLCAEQQVAFLPAGNLDDTALLGPQLVDSFLNLVREAARSDGGVLWEPTATVDNEAALGYRTAATLWSQAPQVAAVYTARHLSGPLESVPDDADVVNDVTASGPRGEDHAELSSGRLSTRRPPDGVGRYSGQVDVNVPGDAMKTHAHWHLTKGTVEGIRYPQVRFDLARNPHLSGLAAAILEADLGDRLTISSMPVWTTPNTVTQLIEGVAAEELTPFDHSVTLFCSPEAAYHGGIWDNAGSRWDADSQTSAAFVAGTDTQLVVATPSGPLWTTDAGEFPFDVTAAGVRLAVTGIGSGFKDTFARTVSNGWGSASGAAGGWAWVNEGGAASDYNVAGGVGTVEDDEAGGATRRVFLPMAFCQANNLVDLEALWSVSIPVVATGTEGPQASMLVREDGTNANFYVFRVIFGLSNNIQIRISIRQAGVETTLVDAPGSQATYVGGTVIHVRNRIAGDQMFMRCWAGADPEPREWQATAVDATFAGVGRVGLRSSADLGFAGTLPLVFTWSKFDIVSPQRFTVSAAPVNGVVKTIPAGSALSLADPVRWTLTGGPAAAEEETPSATYGPRVAPGVAGAEPNPNTTGYTEVRKAAGVYNAQTVAAGTLVLPEVGAEGQVTFTGQTSFGAGSALYGITLSNTGTQWTTRVQAADVKIEQCDFAGNPTIEHIRWEQFGMDLRACKFAGNPTNHTVKVDGRTTLNGGGVIADCEFGGSPVEDAVQCEGQKTTTIEYCRYVGTPGEDYIDIKSGDAVTVRGIDFTSATSREAVLAQNSGGVYVSGCRFGANCFMSFGANLISVVGSVSDCVFLAGSTLRLRKSFDVEVTALTLTPATIVLGTSTADDFPRLANIHHNAFTNLTISVNNASSTTITNNNTYSGTTTGVFPSGNN